jgi:hypothetical protein
MAAIPARLHHLVVVILLLVPSLTAAQSRAFEGNRSAPIP